MILKCVQEMQNKVQAWFERETASLQGGTKRRLDRIQTELEKWTEQAKFYRSFHSNFYQSVRQSGTKAYHAAVRREKEVRLKVCKLEAQVLELELMCEDEGVDVLDGYGARAGALHELPNEEDMVADDAEDLGDSNGGEVVKKMSFREKKQKSAEQLTDLRQQLRKLNDERSYLHETFIEIDNDSNKFQQKFAAEFSSKWYVPKSELELKTRIGSGEYGDVYKALHMGSLVAVKVVKVAFDAAFVTEFKLWSELRSPAIIQLLGYTKVEGHHAMIMPFAEQSLEGYLKTCPQPIKDPRIEGKMDFQLSHPSWNSRVKIAKQIAAGMAYLHAQQDGILHRDLKSANVLLQGQGMEAKICDFGFSKSVSWARSMSARPKGSPITMAPEVYRSGNSAKAADVFGFGIVLWEIIYCQTPYYHLPEKINEIQFMDYVLGGGRPLVAEDRYLPPSVAILQKMCKQCWNKDVDVRPNFEMLSQKLSDFHAHLQNNTLPPPKPARNSSTGRKTSTGKSPPSKPPPALPVFAKVAKPPLLPSMPPPPS